MRSSGKLFSAGTLSMLFEQRRLKLGVKKIDYSLWLGGNALPMALYYIAFLGIWLVHGESGVELPGPEVLLVTAVTLLTVTGIAYQRCSIDSSPNFSIVFYWAWLILAFLALAIFVAMSVGRPAPRTLKIYLVTFGIFAFCFFWSTVVWLDAEIMREDEIRRKIEIKEPVDLQRKAAQLPKTRKRVLEKES
jgi:hypothetical protein